MGPLSTRQKEWKRQAAEKLGNTDGWVLDAACGTGSMMGQLERLPFRGRLVAIDASKKMVRKAWERARRTGLEVQAVLADVSRLPLKAEALQGILCVFSITTVSRPEEAVSEFRRALSQGGRLIVLDSQKPRGMPAKLIYPVLVPISRIFCHTHIDRDIDSVLEGQRDLTRGSKTAFMGGMVGLHDYRKLPTTRRM